MDKSALITILDKLAPHRSMAKHLSGVLQQYDFSDEVVHKIAKIISKALHEFQISQDAQKRQKAIKAIQEYNEDLGNPDDLLLSL